MMQHAGAFAAVLASAVCTACSLAPGTAHPSDPPATAPGAAGSAQQGAAAGCAVTAAVQRPVPTPLPGPAEQWRPSLGSGPWYTSADGRLWAAAGDRWLPGATKVMWLKPVGSRPTVTGRRLDAAAPPLEGVVAEGYPGDFQSSSLHVPTEGCWEVDARANGSSLRFVVRVDAAPRPPTPVPGPGACDGLTGAVRASEAIVVAHVEESEVDPPRRYGWQTARVLDVLKTATPRRVGERVVLLQDARREPLLEAGRTYLLFLQDQDGPWQLVCPQRTFGEVVDPLNLVDQVNPPDQSGASVQAAATEAPFWSPAARHAEDPRLRR